MCVCVSVCVFVCTDCCGLSSWWIDRWIQVSASLGYPHSVDLFVASHYSLHRPGEKIYGGHSHIHYDAYIWSSCADRCLIEYRLVTTGHQEGWVGRVRPRWSLGTGSYICEVSGPTQTPLGGLPTQQDPTGPKGTQQDLKGPNRTQQDPTGPNRTKQDLKGPKGTQQDPTGPNRT